MRDEESPPRPRQSLFAGLIDEEARRQKYRDVFDTVLGREVLADILARNGFFAQEAAAGVEDANFARGTRWVCGDILKAMGADDPARLTLAIVNDDVNEVMT